MRQAQYLQQYRQVATLTAPPGQIVLMLYDGAIRSIERALPGFGLDDPAEANMTVNNNLRRALDIVRELNYALNMEEGGECAITLRRLYDYFDRRLLDSNLRKHPAGAQEVLGHISELRDAWATMLSRQSRPAAERAVSPPATMADN